MQKKKTTTNKRNKNNRKKYANVEGKISSHKTCTLICLYKHFVHVLKQTRPPIKLKKKKERKKTTFFITPLGKHFFFILQSAGYHDSFFFTFDFIVHISNCLSRNNLPTATNVPQLIFSLKAEVLPHIGELIFYGLEMKIELSNFKMLMTVVPAHNTLRMKTINI